MSEIIEGSSYAILPDAPRAEDYVIKLEQRLERERAGETTTLCRQLCEVALQEIQDERDAGSIDFATWKALKDRVADVAE